MLCGAPPDQRQGQQAQQRQRRRQWSPQTLLTSSRLHWLPRPSAQAGGPHRALGQKQPAPGRSREGPQDLHGQEAWLAFPWQLPELLGGRGAGLQAQTLPDRGPRGGGQGKLWDQRGWEKGWDGEEKRHHLRHEHCGLVQGMEPL